MFPQPAVGTRFPARAAGFPSRQAVDPTTPHTRPLGRLREPAHFELAALRQGNVADARTRLGQPIQTQTATWSPPRDVAELKVALERAEPTLKALGKDPAIADWQVRLTAALQREGLVNPEQHNGVAMVMRFPAAYPRGVNHVALAAVHRQPAPTIDGVPRLTVDILHQESLPPEIAPRNGNAIGRVYARLDTSDEFPGGVAPAIESMRLSGGPDTSLVAVEHAGALPEVQRFHRDLGDHPYGPCEDLVKPRVDELAGKTAQTCFDVTATGMRALQEGQIRFERASMTPQSSDLFPDTQTAQSLRRMAPYCSITPAELDTVRVGRGTMTVEDALSQGALRAGMGFLALGTSWGNGGRWDVPGGRVVQLASKQGSAPPPILQSKSQPPLQLPPDALAFKLEAPVPDATILGLSLQAGRTYDAKVAEEVVYDGPSTSVPLAYAVARQVPPGGQ